MRLSGIIKNTNNQHETRLQYYAEQSRMHSIVEQKCWNKQR